MPASGVVHIDSWSTQRAHDVNHRMLQRHRVIGVNGFSDHLYVSAARKVGYVAGMVAQTKRIVRQQGYISLLARKASCHHQGQHRLRHRLPSSPSPIQVAMCGNLHTCNCDPPAVFIMRLTPAHATAPCRHEPPCLGRSLVERAGNQPDRSALMRSSLSSTNAMSFSFQSDLSRLLVLRGDSCTDHSGTSRVASYLGWTTRNAKATWPSRMCH